MKKNKKLSNIEIVSRSRANGKTETFTLEMLHHLKHENAAVAVAGLKEPKDLIDSLQKKGMTVIASKMYRQDKDTKKDIFTGYLFEKHGT